MSGAATEPGLKWSTFMIYQKNLYTDDVSYILFGHLSGGFNRRPDFRKSTNSIPARPG